MPFSRMRMIWLVRRREWVDVDEFAGADGDGDGGVWVMLLLCLVAKAERKSAKDRRDLRMVRGFYLDGGQIGKLC